MLYLNPTKRHLGVEIIGAEEEHLDLYDALLELVECADGIDSAGVVNLTPFNAHIFDFLDLLRHAEPVPREYLDSAESPAGGKTAAAGPSEGGADESGGRGKPAGAKVLAFPGVNLEPASAPKGDEEDDDDGGGFLDDDTDPLDLNGEFDDMEEEVLAALEEYRRIEGLSEDEIAGAEGLILDDDLMVRLLWPEAVHLAFSLNEFLGWSDSSRDAEWTPGLRWRPAYGTVLRFQAQLIDCVCSAVPMRNSDQARELFQSQKVSVRGICYQYLDLLGEEFVLATTKRRKAMLAPVIAEIAKPGPRNAQILKEAEAKAKELGCPVDEIAFTGEFPDDLEW